jgi:hypothetical protein
MKVPLVLFAVTGGSESLPAQPQEQLRVKTMLLFDCAVSSETDQTKNVQLEVSYIAYANDPRYQVNFKDPAHVLFKRPGWAPKGEFVLARLTTDGHLFAWLGKRTEESPFSEIETVVRVTPAKDGGVKSTLSLEHFVSDESSGSKVETFRGECDSLSGKAAWERYQN